MKRSGTWTSLLAGVLVAVAAATAAEFRDAGDGIAYREDRFPREPWILEVVRVERGRPGLSFLPTLGQWDRIGLGTLTEQLAAIPRDAGVPMVAINGDFFETEDQSYPGDPRGLFISRGELVSTPSSRDCFWIDREGNPRIGIVKSELQLVWPDGGTTPVGLNEDPEGLAGVLLTRAAGSAMSARKGIRIALERSGDGPWLPLRMGETYTARAAGASGKSADGLVLVGNSALRARIQELKAGGTVRIAVRTQPDLSGTSTAIGGGPALVRAGKALSMHAPKSDERHPRSAIGWNSKYFFFVVVDGRQDDSDGMTLPELASYLVQLGCDEAMNLDGGGSTELWLRGRILNHPCYGRERRTATGLVLVRAAVPPRATGAVTNGVKPAP
ncbi:MAG: phosphodiester glycosidase family protein [Verrucomicrobiales bacterium]|nr:phosphodiester glycosidase family protein [Verrucomicrobiales bacterium]